MWILWWWDFSDYGDDEHTVFKSCDFVSSRQLDPLSLSLLISKFCRILPLSLPPSLSLLAASASMQITSFPPIHNMRCLMKHVYLTFDDSDTKEKEIWAGYCHQPCIMEDECIKAVARPTIGMARPVPVGHTLCFLLFLPASTTPVYKWTFSFFFVRNLFVKVGNTSITHMLTNTGSAARIWNLRLPKGPN